MSKEVVLATTVLILLGLATGLYLWRVPTEPVRVHERVFQFW